MWSESEKQNQVVTSHLDSSQEFDDNYNSTIFNDESVKMDNNSDTHLHATVNTRRRKFIIYKTSQTSKLLNKR